MPIALFHLEPIQPFELKEKNREADLSMSDDEADLQSSLPSTSNSGSRGPRTPPPPVVAPLPPPPPPPLTSSGNRASLPIPTVTTSTSSSRTRSASRSGSTQRSGGHNDMPITPVNPFRFTNGPVSQREQRIRSQNL